MKKILLGFSSLFILLIGAALVAPALIDISQYKAQALEQVKTMTGHEVAINGAFSVSLLPSPKAYAENIVVKAPEGAAAENLASIGRVDLHLAIAPLLSGKIAISQVSFVDPEIAIEVLADGRQSWQTPELDALMAAKEPQPGEQPLDISIQNFGVQNGKFTYADKAKGSDVKLSDINLSMGADSMQGPFKGQGAFLLGEQKIAFEGHTGRMGGGATSMAVNADVSVDDALKLTYAGVMGLGGALDLQGETALKIDNLQKFASSFGADLKAFKAASLEMKGVLNAKPEAVSLKDMVLDLSGDRFTGSLEGAFAERLSLKGGLSAEKPINLDKLIDIAPGAGGAAQDAAFLPKTISLPPVDLAVALKAPAVIYKGEEYRSVDIEITNAPGAASIAVKAASIPGPGTLNLEATVKQDKTPSVAIALKADSKNLPFTLESLGIPVDPKSVEAIKTASADINANIYASRIDFDNSTVEIDGSPVAFSGSYSASGPSGKPVLRLNAAAGTLDMNDFMPAAPKTAPEGEPAPAANPADIKATLATLALPFDFDFDISAESLTVQDHTFKGLAASGEWVKNALTLSGFSVKDFAGAAVQAKGKLDNIQTLQGVDLTLGAQASDVRAVAKVLGLDASALPANLGRTDVSASLKGSADNMNVLANIKALNGEVIVQGAVADPLGAMKADKLSLQVKHRSVNEAIGIFAPGSGNYSSLSGPLDFYTDVQMADNVTQMNNIKARLAGASVQGQMSVNTGSSKPDISGSFTFDDLVIQSAGGSAAASQGGAPQWSREAIDTAWMHGVNFDVSLSGNSLKYEGWDLVKPVIKAKLNDGMLSVSQMDAGMFDGQIAMKASVQAGKGERQPLQIQADAKIRDVSLEPLVKAFVGVPLIKGSGRISMDNVMNASGISPAALVYDLSGNGAVTGKDIVLDGLDLTRFAKALSEETKPGDTALGLWKGTTKGGSTRFDTLDGDYTIQEGVINISKLDLDGAQATIATTGRIDLPKWFIDTDHKILVKGQDIPEFTVEINGPLDNPGNTFAQGVLNNYLERKIERKLQNVIQDKLGDKLDGKLGGVLGGILGGGAAKTPPAAPAPAPVAPVQPQTQQAAPAVAPAANDNEPAAGEGSWQQPAAQPQAQPAPAQQQQQQPTPEDAVKDLLKGFMQ